MMAFIPSKNEFLQFALIALVTIAVVNNVGAVNKIIKAKG